MQDPADRGGDRGAAGQPDAPPAAAPRSNRGILLLGLLLCIAGAVAAAWLLGLLDRAAGLAS